MCRVALTHNTRLPTNNNCCFPSRYFLHLASDSDNLPPNPSQSFKAKAGVEP
jgi:hypothetical protein